VSSSIWYGVTAPYDRHAEGYGLWKPMETPRYYEFMTNIDCTTGRGGTLTNEEIVDAVALSCAS
jgi:hypothetical protein